MARGEGRRGGGKGGSKGSVRKGRGGNGDGSGSTGGRPKKKIEFIKHVAPPVPGAKPDIQSTQMVVAGFANFESRIVKPDADGKPSFDFEFGMEEVLNATMAAAPAPSPAKAAPAAGEAPSRPLPGARPKVKRDIFSQLQLPPMPQKAALGEEESEGGASSPIASRSTPPPPSALTTTTSRVAAVSTTSAPQSASQIAEAMAAWHKMLSTKNTTTGRTQPVSTSSSPPTTLTYPQPAASGSVVTTVVASRPSTATTAPLRATSSKTKSITTQMIEYLWRSNDPETKAEAKTVAEKAARVEQAVADNAIDALEAEKIEHQRTRNNLEAISKQLDKEKASYAGIYDLLAETNKKLNAIATENADLRSEKQTADAKLRQLQTTYQKEAEHYHKAYLELKEAYDAAESQLHSLKSATSERQQPPPPQLTELGPVTTTPLAESTQVSVTADTPEDEGEVTDIDEGPENPSPVSVKVEEKAQPMEEEKVQRVVQWAAKEAGTLSPVVPRDYIEQLSSLLSVAQQASEHVKSAKANVNATQRRDKKTRDYPDWAAYAMKEADSAERAAGLAGGLAETAPSNVSDRVRKGAATIRAIASQTHNTAEEVRKIHDAKANKREQSAASRAKSKKKGR